ncbi:Protein F26H9.5 [Aphelenchoides avenae]|nr:Protein F26H9.5 [Aphelenchus avenae]
MSNGKKTINFGPGPAKLPEAVLEKAHQEFFHYENTGISVLGKCSSVCRHSHASNLELSHRSAEFTKIIKTTESLLRELLWIPDEYAVLFMQGGGTGQFAAVPCNLHFLAKNSEKPSADYAITGSWSDKGAKEAAKFINVKKVFDVQKPFTTIPDASTWKLDPEAAYVYYCANETIHGIEFHEAPKVPDNVALVADISSNILSRPFDVFKHALVFAGTQKNLGIAGLTIVIVRRDLLGHAVPHTPGILDYEELHKNNSVYNTPSTYGVCMTKLVLEWIRDQGGVNALYERNQTKARLIYDLIDGSKGFYHSVVDKKCRSNMNIPFRVGGPEGNADLEALFVKESAADGMISLKGHRSVGGIRASLFNAVTLAEAQHLADFMKEFQQKHA